MKKNINAEEDMAPEYDFSKGERGKHYEKMKGDYSVTVYSSKENSDECQIVEKLNYIRIENDVNEYFKNSREVNNALRALIKAIPKHNRKLLKKM